MKTSQLIIPTLALSLFSAGAAYSGSPVIELASNSQNAPITINGTSGGSNKSNCGSISQSPSQVIKVTPDRINYMRISVRGEGQPTLLVDGPTGRFCVLADSGSGEKPEISGFWVKGTYAIYVGDRTGGQHPYTLSITQSN